MRAKFSYLLPGLLGLMLAVALSASAQDDVPGPTGGASNTTISNLFSQDAQIYDEKPLLMEQSVRPLSDSLQHKVVPVPAAKSKNDPKKPQAEGDPLNFNFLYYILQKFKASELMME